MFKELDAKTLTVNPFNMIGKDWMLICAGKGNSYNMMTAAWGAFGVIWNRDVCFAFIRPNRYTFSFVEANNYFTLSFFGEDRRDLLKLCGTKSGRDIDKMNLPGLTPVFEEPGYIYFSESALYIATRKIYYQDLDPDHFLDSDIIKNYPEKSFHRCYIGEIIKIGVKEENISLFS